MIKVDSYMASVCTYILSYLVNVVLRVLLPKAILLASECVQHSLTKGIARIVTSGVRVPALTVKPVRDRSFEINISKFQF